jgi:hypothetical protein
MAARMKVAITFDRVDSGAAIALSNQFGAPNEDTGDTDTTIRGATPGLGAQRTVTWNAMDAPTITLMVKFAWDRASVRNINLEKVLR